MSKKNNTIIFAGCKDNLINTDYMKRDYISPHSNNELFLFKNSGHCNISKYDYDLYKKVLEEVILKYM